MKKTQKQKEIIFTYIGVGIFFLLISAFIIFCSIQNDKMVKAYTERCEKIGWDICEAEYYSTHTQNGLPK